jgi:hypothetical protein
MKFQFGLISKGNARFKIFRKLLRYFIITKWNNISWALEAYKYKNLENV